MPDSVNSNSINAAVENAAAKIAEAAANRAPLVLQGGGGKSFYGNPAAGEVLDLSALCGVREYEPSELYIAAGAATPLADIETLLAKHNQMLAFEPPHYSPRATIGGALACGLSGPRRPAAGALRDHILGAGIIDGRGKTLQFGGKVIKNVAGFDVSRLMAGALGVLGAITEVVFRTAPRPECEITATMECTAANAIAADADMLAAGLPLSGAAWHGGQVWRRFSGGEESLRRAVAECGGDVLDDEEQRDFWRAINEHRHPFFGDDENLWRLAVPAISPPQNGDDFIEWHGAVRWRRGDAAAAKSSAQKSGGAATLFRAQNPNANERFPLPAPPVFKIYRNLKKAFDPEDIFNRGRLYDFSQ